MKSEQGTNNSNALSTSAPRNRVSYEKFLIEKNAKNKAYSFILSQGLLDKFREFINAYDSHDPHEDCARYFFWGKYNQPLDS